ncbi:tyrosine-type recombinase/integrase [Vitreoscilla massiliensis]|uniref:Tyrosine-type recombinase/integrase n=1 Tax=Vitreoscilla massiliensis TaxID=1689272 RepID=A0ABY4E6U9_9NEIS|nr:site-specific integrase [Vitreoscilla massiliensis]UOO90108.1 tyrosine-type recombinase/integrase [Vitreoscilla massiliensis]
MMHYPKAGKGKKWTIKELNVITADWKGDTISDGEGLIGEVRVSKSNDISIRFKYAFKWDKKVSWFSCGTYPDNDMLTIRQNRDEAKATVAKGIDPRLKKQADKVIAQQEILAVIDEAKELERQNLTVRDMFDEWVANGVARQDNNQELKRLFEKDVLPMLGSMPIKEIKEADIRNVYRVLLERGTEINPRNRSLVRLAADVRQMFKWADARQPWRALLVEGNPALLVDEKKLLDADYTEERSRVLSADEIIQLAQLIKLEEQQFADALDKRNANKALNASTQCAIWICLSTLSRIGELLMARWEHIDFETKEWFIPRENVKSTRGKKQDHYVFLSDFAFKQFQRLYEESGHSDWCFPAKDEKSHVDVKSVSKRIGDRQVKFKDRTKVGMKRRHDNSLAVGDSEWTPHDLRRTGATMMQELGIGMDIIDRCQNHVLAGSKVRRHYLKYEYKVEKTEAFEKLGKKLQGILKDSNVN